MLEAAAIRGPEETEGLDTHQETADEILLRLDDEAIASLAETGTVEDVRAVVEMLIEDNPELRPYLIEFQQANSATLAAELQRVAVNDNEEIGADDEVPEEESRELIQQAQSYLYESLDIDENHANNGALTNFAKGIVDTLIFENVELAVEVIETRGGVILDALKQIATWKGIKGVLSALGESIWDLFSGDAYEKGKSVADLGIVATGIGVAATVGRKAITAAVRQMDTPSPNNLDRTLIDDISKLPDTERLEAAGVFLGKDFINNPDFETQRQAILDAHNFGERLDDGNYSLGDLREKTRILREAGLTSGEIRTLFDNNICGKEFPEFRNIYEDPRFDYLAEYRDILGEITEADIISDKGTQAVIIQHPTDEGQIIKIAKPGEVDDLNIEFENHQRFYDIWEQGVINGDIPKNVIIPKVIKGDRDGYFYMDKIEGQSLYGVTLREKYSHVLVDESPEFLKMLSDTQLERLLLDEYKQYPGGIQSTIDDWSGDYLGEALGMSYSYRMEHGRTGGTPLHIAIEHLREQGLVHNDMHPGNIMVDNSGNFYIIDFGRVRITE
ncbi:phosphotransferase [Candidatus Gracilibacteria bacterium]|nr:phosphotransferase [Candidatus Gracilibacteria bacterium]